MADDIIAQLEKKRKRHRYQHEWKKRNKEKVKKYPSMQKRRGIRKPVFRGTPCKWGHIAMRDSHGYCRKCKKESEKKSATISIRRKIYKEKNKETIKIKNAAYVKNNRSRINACVAKRRAQFINATPIWVNLEEIRKIYEQCTKISRETGVIYHVDHVIPLRGKNVCGLHVHTNLQVIEGSKNKSKNNKYECE